MIHISGRIQIDSRRAEKKILQAVKRIEMRQGAYLRGVARRKIRYRKNPNKYSAPGAAPFTHGDKRLKNSILFAHDAARQSVLVGPSSSWIGDVAALHEYGGTRRVRVPMPIKTKFKVGDVGPVRAGKYKSVYVSPNRKHWTDPLKGEPLVWTKLTSPTMRDHAQRAARRLANAHRKTKVSKYPQRPFMGPALEESRGRLLQMVNESGW